MSIHCTECQNICRGESAMTNQELNEYIKHYFEEDKTQRAIMLSAPWGSGKSYYIRHELVQYLKDNGGHSCVIVSLYGLKSLKELNKELYFESKAPVKQEKKKIVKKLTAVSKPVLTGTIGVGKTILKALTSIDLDFSLDNPNWEKLYESVDYSSKLIVFEDLERSGIDILEILGYVNKLVEIDGVKVLLVANEEELIQHKQNERKESPDENVNELLEKLNIKGAKEEYTEKSIQYLRTKEKTIGDTIYFSGNLKAAVTGILQVYNKTPLKTFATEQIADDIVKIMLQRNCTNLRSIFFACQKTSDIFKKLPNLDGITIEFRKAVFYGIVNFTLRLRTGPRSEWVGLEYYSLELGSNIFPLFRFCYDYIMEQRFDDYSIPATIEAFNIFQLYDQKKAQFDPDVQFINGYYLHSERDVQKTVERIAHRLEDPGDLPFYNYGLIAAALITIKHNLKFKNEESTETTGST